MHTAPLFLELAGLPAAGKSTLAALLTAEVAALGYRCTLLAEQAARCPLTHLKGDPRYSAWTLCESLTGLLEAEQAAQGIVLIDRGLIDALGWVEWFRQTGRIGAADAAAIEGFIRIPAWFERTHLTVVLRVGFETALFRRGSRGRILNESTFRELRTAYDALLAREDIARRTLVVDTDDLAPVEVLDRVLAALPPLRQARVVR